MPVLYRNWDLIPEDSYEENVSFTKYNEILNNVDKDNNVNLIYKALKLRACLVFQNYKDTDLPNGLWLKARRSPLALNKSIFMVLGRGTGAGSLPELGLSPGRTLYR